MSGMWSPAATPNTGSAAGDACVLRLESRAEASSLMASFRRSLPWHHRAWASSSYLARQTAACEGESLVEAHQERSWP